MTSAAPSPSPGSRPTIRLRGLSKRFGDRTALRDVDLDLDGPALVAVTGPDGSGKTTLLRAVAGLLEVYAERADVLGFDLRRNVRDLKAQIGYVPQVFALQAQASVAENLAFTARLHGMPRQTFRERAEDLLERTELAPFRDRPTGALSGGMKQKLAVANALLPEPSLLVLDEPTAGVDVIARAEILELLRLACGRGALVLLSTSYLDEAAASDHVVYLDGGRVLASGVPDALRRRAQVDVYRVWGEAPRQLAAAARALAYVSHSRVAGQCARVDVPTPASPPPEQVRADLLALPGARLVEALAADMESTLLALSEDADSGDAP